MSDYDDDRYGCMRVHIAAQRGDLACKRYTRNHLRAVARGKGLPTGSLTKQEIAWEMAQAGLLDARGIMRDGFPEATR